MVYPNTPLYLLQYKTHHIRFQTHRHVFMLPRNNIHNYYDDDTSTHITKIKVSHVNVIRIKAGMDKGEELN